MMVLGRSQCREGGAENDGSGECKYCLAEHFYLLVAPILLVALSYERLSIVFIPGSRKMRREGSP
jgi:hypothetical protein